jgi:predicted Zn-dependent peptidase
MTPQSKLPPVKKHVLENGLTVLHQRNPVSRAFCLGIWTRTGSRDERKGEEGLCHFFEHMLFKGTSRRSAFRISQDIEKIGGSLDAFTTKEAMCVYAQVLQDHCDVAFDLIGDMLSKPLFSDKHIALERQVVLQEISDVMDAPDDLIHDLFTDSIFPDHPLGRPILGFPESVATFTRRDLRRIARRMFTGPNVVVAVYGNMPTKELLAACRSLFAFPRGLSSLNRSRLRPFVVERRSIRRKLHQQHVCIGNRTFSYLEDGRFPMMVLTTLAGGGMSSRLFQRIREEMGLAYSVYTYSDHLRDTGLMATYMAVQPRNAALAIDAVVEEYRCIVDGEVTQSELDDTKEQLKGRILLGLETSTARMMRIARNELYYGRQISERELIRRIDAVSLSDIHAVASRSLDSNELSVISMGPSMAGIKAGLKTRRAPSLVEIETRHAR